MLLALPFLTATAHAQQGSSSSTEVRRIEVGADVTEAHTVFIQPERETTLVFKAPLARESVELEQRESFRRLEVGEHSISLVPSANLKPDARLRLAVRFVEGTEPMGALFQLLVTSSRGEQRIEIAGLLPSCEGCANQLQAASAGSDGDGLLTGLLVSGKMDERGIRTRDVVPGPQDESPVKVLQATSFRSVDRVALRLEIQIPGDAPWRMEGAVLQHGGEVLPLKSWPPTALPPGRATLILEKAAGGGELMGNYFLEVREAGGNRALFIRRVDFP